MTDAYRHEQTPIEAAEDAFTHAAQAIIHTAEIAFRIPEPATSRWHRAGVSARGERIFDVVAGLVLALFAIGWTYCIVLARTSGESGVTRATAAIAAGLTNADAPTAAYLTDAVLTALTPLKGASGKLRATFQQPGERIVVDSADTSAAVRVATSPRDTGTAVAPARAGVWSLAVKIGAVLRPVADLNVITLRPFTDKQRGRIGLYYIGSWPGEKSKRKVRPEYANPDGFIEVTAENKETFVSEHFRLRDFLTHDQPTVWPKYLVLDISLVDKLELVLSELEAQGYDVAGVRVMSGFRTPSYNVSGGNTAGRAALSRHMYGDAADIFLDADGNGVMDDLNRDGRVNVRDAQVMLTAVDRVEREHPELVGGAGVYVASAGHGPFIHIDTRGFRARWVGTGDY